MTVEVKMVVRRPDGKKRMLCTTADVPAYIAKISPVEAQYDALKKAIEERYVVDIIEIIDAARQ